MLYVKSVVKNNLKNTLSPRMFLPAMTRAVKRTADVISDSAINYYKKVRGPDNGPVSESLIIQSFTFSPTLNSFNSVGGIVYMDLGIAWYGPLVDKGHAHRNNKGRFKGHHFGEVGRDRGREVANTILLEEIGKIKGVSKKFSGGK